MADWNDIRRVLDYIEKLPKLTLDDSGRPIAGTDPRQDHWFQADWKCSMYSFSPTEPKLSRADCGTAACLAGWKSILDDCTGVYAAEYSKNAWGLTEQQAFVLFGPHNSIEGMRSMVDRWESREAQENG